MVTEKIRSVESLRNINGVGKSKADKYGPAFMEKLGELDNEIRG